MPDADETPSIHTVGFTVHTVVFFTPRDSSLTSLCLFQMLRPLFSRPRPTPRQPEPVPRDYTDEDLQNTMNEELEARLAEDLAKSPGVSGEAIRALEAGQVTLVVVSPGVTPVPASFFTPTPGRFSWTFLPLPDYDICTRGDSNALSFSQIPEQQTPPASPR